MNLLEFPKFTDDAFAHNTGNVIPPVDKFTQSMVQDGHFKPKTRLFVNDLITSAPRKKRRLNNTTNPTRGTFKADDMEKLQVAASKPAIC